MSKELQEKAKSKRGDALRARAVIRLRRACDDLVAAAADLSPLEGRGYCAAFEAAGKLYEEVSRLEERVRRMDPPTGVFEEAL